MIVILDVLCYRKFAKERGTQQNQILEINYLWQPLKVQEFHHDPYKNKPAAQDAGADPPAMKPHQ